MNDAEFLADENATLDYGERLATWLRKPENFGAVVFLRGQLGAGKTTLVRGILRAFGHMGAVKSPTYTLLEPYEELDPAVLHFDFYRVGDSEELDFIGLDEMLAADAVKLIEWPEQADNRLPIADLDIQLELESTGRRISVTAPAAAMSQGNG